MSKKPPIHFLLALLVSILVVSGCRGNATPDPTPITTATHTSIPARTLTPTAIPSATNTPAPTGTPTPTKISPPTPSFEGQPGASGIGDPFYPRQGNGGYDAQHYALDLEVDMVRNTIEGDVTITAQATQNLSAFNLDFGGPEISQVLVNDAPVDFSRDGVELVVELSQSLREGETFTINVAYGGEPGVGMGEPTPGFGSGWSYYGDGVFVANEPSSAVGWYPVNEHPLDKATYSFRMTVPQPFVVAANGLLVDTIDNGTTTTYLWEADDPIASYLVTVNIAEFDVEREQGPHGVLIRNYFAPGVSEETRVEFSRQAEMIELFSDYFGPYPFDVYGAVVHNLDLGFALETQTLPVFGRNTVERVAVHELAHQWFGNSVSLKRWEDIWLNEGFATYAELLWLEHLNGPDALAEVIKATYSFVAPGLMLQEIPRDDLLGGLRMLELDDLSMTRAQVEAALLALFTNSLPEAEISALLAEIPPGGLPGADFPGFLETVTFDEVRMTGQQFEAFLAALGFEERPGRSNRGVIVPPGRPTAEQLFNPGVYQRGGLTLHALRLHVGDETFFEILQTYAARFKDANANTADFIAVAEEVSDQRLNDFFAGWLYAEAIPDLPELDLHREDFALP